MKEKTRSMSLLSKSIKFKNTSVLKRRFRKFIRLEEMIGSGVKPNVVTFTALISANAKEGRVRKMRKLLESVKEQGIPLDVFCYNSIIVGLCRAQKIEEATG